MYTFAILVEPKGMYNVELYKTKNRFKIDEFIFYSKYKRTRFNNLNTE